MASSDKNWKLHAKIYGEHITIMRSKYGLGWVLFMPGNTVGIIMVKDI